LVHDEAEDGLHRPEIKDPRGSSHRLRKTQHYYTPRLRLLALNGISPRGMSRAGVERLRLLTTRLTYSARICVLARTFDRRARTAS
jgi:hypothetical protein